MIQPIQPLPTFQMELRSEILTANLPGDLQPEAARLAAAALQATTPAALLGLFEGLSQLAHGHGGKLKAGQRLDLLRLADRCRLVAAQVDYLDRWAEVCW